MGRQDSRAKARHNVRSGKGDKPIDMARIAEAMRGDKPVPEAMSGTFTARELSLAMQVSHHTAGQYIRDSVEAGTVRYAGKKMLVDVTGSRRPTHCYKYVGKEAK